MTSAFQSMGSTAGWRHHQILSDLEASPAPDRFKKKSSLNLNAARMSLRKRMPLKEVEMNFEENPTWESLEAKEKKQNLRALTRRAKTAFGTVSQKIQGSCQAPTRLLVASLTQFPGSSVRGSVRNKSSPPRTPRRRSGRLAGVSSPTSSTRIVSPFGQETPDQAGSRQLKKDFFPLRRSVRAAALRSPYGSPLSASQRRQFDRDLELVSTGIRQLKRLSRAFNDIIVQEERDQAILNYYQVMAENLRAAQRHSGRLSKSLVWRRPGRRRWPFRSRTGDHLKQY
nr:protein FAM64A [Pogona vitticeps]